MPDQDGFKCEPGKLCEGAACCRSNETFPSLTIGDFLRLSEFTGESPAQIWRTKGYAKLVYNGWFEMNDFFVKPTLLHDPCPYLTSELKCSVYEARPLTCAGFPMLSYSEDDYGEGSYGTLANRAETYSCVNAKPSFEQIEFGNRLCEIIDRERSVAMPLYKPTYRNLCETAKNAVELVKQRDPEYRSKRSQSVMKSNESVSQIIQQHTQIIQEYGWHDIDLDLIEHIELVRPLLYYILEDQVANELESLDVDIIEHCRTTSRKFRELLKTTV